jgi:hypothetical protein
VRWSGAVCGCGISECVTCCLNKPGQLTHLGIVGMTAQCKEDSMGKLLKALSREREDAERGMAHWDAILDVHVTDGRAYKPLPCSR